MSAQHTPGPCLTPDSDELEFVDRYARLRAKGFPMREAAKAADRDMRADAQNMAAADATIAKATGSDA